jgi:hypothetical protein
VDNIPPEVTIRPGDIVIQGDEIVYVSGECTFDFDKSDDKSGVAHVLASIDGEGFRKVEDYLRPLPGGRHVIEYRAVDMVGNESEVSSFSVEVDNLPPETSWRTKPQLVNFRGNLFGPRGLLLKFFPDDNLSGVENIELDINNEMLPGVVKGEDESMKMVKEGRYLLTYFSIDRVKNSERAKELVFTIDGTPPEVDLSIEGPQHEGMARLYISGSSVIHIDAQDEVSGVNRIELSRNGQPFIAYQGPIKGLAQGVSQITYLAVDNVGNASNKKDIRITVDNTPPEVWIAQGNEGAWVIRALDNLSGVHEVFARVDGGKLKRYKDGDILPEGSRVEFYAVDNVGNQTERAERALN